MLGSCQDRDGYGFSIPAAQGGITAVIIERVLAKQVFCKEKDAGWQTKRAINR